MAVFLEPVKCKVWIEGKWRFGYWVETIEPGQRGHKLLPGRVARTVKHRPGWKVVKLYPEKYHLLEKVEAGGEIPKVE